MRKSTLYFKLCLLAIVGGLWTNLTAQIINEVSITCPGMKNGQLHAHHNNFGTAPYTYNWKNSLSATISTDSIVKGLGADTYTLTITDATLPIPSTKTITYTLKNPLPITNTFTITPNSTWPSFSGLLAINSSGGNGGYTYSIKDSTSNQTTDLIKTATYSNIPSGKYYIVTTDITGCLRYDTVKVAELNTYLTNANKSKIIVKIDTTVCYKAFNATSSFKPDTANITCPIILEYDQHPKNSGFIPNSMNNDTIVGYIKGGDNFHIWNSNSSIYKTLILPIDPALNPATSYYVTRKSFSKVTTGPNIGLDTIVSLQSSFGQSTYGAGFHNVYVYTANNKGFRHYWYVDSVVTPIAINFTQKNNSCFRDSKGAFSVTVNGSYETEKNKFNIAVSGPLGNPMPFSPITNGTQYNTSSNLPAGIYTITATDSKTCTNTQTITITEPSDSLRIIFENNDACTNGKNGKVAIKRVDGGAKYPINYLWDTGETTPTLSNLAVGKYYVNITDQNGCTDRDSVSVNSIDRILNIVWDPIINTRCPFSSDGELSIRGINGAEYPVTYKWSSGDSTQTLENLKPGKYTVEVTDKNNCIVSDSVEVESLNKSCFYNIVTPNGDGYNDYFDLTDLSKDVKLDCKIFNEAGNLVATLNETNPKWDTLDQSKPPTGTASTYTAFVKITKDGKTLAEFGESFSVIYSK